MTTLNQAVKSLNVRRGVESALNNELKTRLRVEELEWKLARIERWLSSVTQDVQNMRRLGFRGRLRWLFLGKVDK